MTFVATERFAVLRSSSGTAPAPDLPPRGHFIGGSFVPGTSPATIDVENPATGTVLATVPAGTIEDVDAAVAAAVSAKTQWANTTPKHRSDILHRIADIIQSNRALLESLESANTGKPQAVAEDDISSAIDTFRFTAGAARTLTSLAAGEYAEGHTSVILREPVGVVGVITPWNYPLLMAAWKIAPILATGNTVVLKPSEQTPLSTLKLAELIAGELPPGVLNIVTGTGQVVGQHLAEHAQVDLVAITGSVASGHKVAAAAAGSVKRVHLELGGKAPVIIFADADLDRAVDEAVKAKFATSGQDCLGANRFLVERPVYHAFCKAFAERTEALTVGPGMDDPDIGPLMNEAAIAKQVEHVADAMTKGATLLTGGRRHKAGPLFFQPTVLADVPEDALVMHEETFGPVAAIAPFDTEEEAFARANATEYGLVAYLHTQDPRRIYRASRALAFGMVAVNRTKVTGAPIPFGGMKQSGLGREGSRLGLEAFTEVKYVCRDWS